MLSWTASTDSAGVTGYEIFANGISKGTLTGMSSTLTALTPNTLYQFTVRARDAAGNWSAQSAVRTAKTWQRLYSSSGHIDGWDNYDENGNYTGSSSSTDTHPFYLTPSGTIRISVTTGNSLKSWDYVPGIGWTGSFNGPQISTFNASTGNVWVYVTGINDGDSGDYTVSVDLSPSGQPSASFATTSILGRAPLPVAFNGAASVDPLGAIASYAWDFDNNGTTDATGQAASTSYSNAGSITIIYTAKLTTTGPSGSANTTRTITVYPASSYAITVQNGTTSLPYQLSGSAVSLTATAPPGGGTFTGWLVVSGAGSFANAAAASTTFTMGSSDAVVCATYGTDNTAPSAPTALNYADKTATTVTLVWRASTDNVGVAGYTVFRGGTQVGATSDLALADSGLAANTSYSYTIKAFDAAGNLSAASTAFGVTTTQDFSADSDHDGIPDTTETALGTNGSAAANPDITNQTQQTIHRPIQ